MVRMERSEVAVNWRESLAAFLGSQPGVAAVRLDPQRQRVSVATLGPVDEAALREALRETLANLPGGPLTWGGGPTAGLTVKEGAGVSEISAPSCVTAPRFWVWREFTWPEATAETAAVEPLAEEVEDWRTLAVLAGLCGGLGLVAWVWTGWGGSPAWPGPVLYALALLAGAWDAAGDAWTKLRRGKVDIHFLMLAVAAGAGAIGAWGEAVLLLFLFSGSGAMEAYALGRTHREVEALLRASPKQARRVTAEGREEDIAVEEVRVGDVLRVRPGDAFAADGQVRQGRSASDESALSGESLPVEKTAGDPVFSGTLNLWGALEFTVTKLPAESTLQKIIRLIRTAQGLRAPSERFTDRFGGTYTLVVLGLCAGLFLWWWLGQGLNPFTPSGGEVSAFYRAMTLLVVMSPCALVLSIPSAILAAIAWGARHGVLFRGGAAIEHLATIGVVALDKTGTLTTGELRVERYESFPAGHEEEVMRLAASLEAQSTHPLARAILRDTRQRGIEPRPVEAFAALHGQGVRGAVEGRPVLLGRRELWEAGPLGPWARDLPTAPAELAEVWLVRDDLVGRVLLRDEIRPESAGVLRDLRAAGLRVVMLTGDRRQTAEQVARELGMDDVRSGLSPADKVEAILALRADGRKVAMVGDGVNDAPSLAAADVSVAMGARGSDAALEQAEVVLMDDRIENFLAAYRLSQRATRIIRQNLAVSLGVVAVMGLGSVLFPLPLGLGVAAHEGSTVLVCLNSLRLLWRGGA
jgi:Zn2+/Cd2+-exporting ATPase